MCYALYGRQKEVSNCSKQATRDEVCCNTEIVLSGYFVTPIMTAFLDIRRNY